MFTITNVFSKRTAKLNKEEPDVYEYDVLNDRVKRQIQYIIEDSVSAMNYPNTHQQLYKAIVDVLVREYGKDSLSHVTWDDCGNRHQSYQSELFEFFRREQCIDKNLDVIELAFRVLNNEDATKMLNTRLQEHSIGYQFQDGKIIKVDSQFIHHEVVKRALLLTQGKGYQGVQVEFLSAHEHYRKQRYKESIIDCNKAFESTMKVICDRNNWAYNPSATASSLVDICFANNLIPDFWKQSMSSLRTLLSSSISTLRNKLAHGGGANIQTVPNEVVAFALHLTASIIVFLIETDNNKQ